MSKLNLKYITEKEGDYYFKINEPAEFLKKHEYKEGTDQYYPFWKSRDGRANSSKGADSDDYLLKVKSKYIPESGVNKEEPFDAEIELKSFRMQASKGKKLKYGYYVSSFK